MPDWIENVLEINGDAEEVNEVIETIKGDPYKDGRERKIDFNKISPMPPELDIEASDRGKIAHFLLFGYSDEFYNQNNIIEIHKRFSELSLQEQKEAVDIGLAYQQNLIKHNSRTWYEWCWENWGTKWNADHFEIRNSPNLICFRTAWEPRICLMKKLSTMFPKVTLRFSYTEPHYDDYEQVIIENGEVSESSIKKLEFGGNSEEDEPMDLLLD
jgi:hypothetical protein